MPRTSSKSSSGEGSSLELDLWPDRDAAYDRAHASHSETEDEPQSSSMHSEDSPETRSVKETKKQTKLTLKVARQKDLQAQRKTAYKTRSPEQPRTESEEQLLEHFRKYPKIKPGRVVSPLVYDTIEPLLPPSVILTVTMHGRTLKPFLTPVNVVRYIHTAFGTCSYTAKVLPPSIRDIMRMGAINVDASTMPKSEYRFDDFSYIDGEAIKSRMIRKLKDIRHYYTRRRKVKELAMFANQDKMDEFLASKGHEVPKRIKHDFPMFNKSYSVGTDTTHVSHSIFIRANVPWKRHDEDTFYEIQTARTTLQKILLFLYERGVKDVTLFDTSCQGDDGEEIHRTRYGGK
jgi:hypothetical protein